MTKNIFLHHYYHSKDMGN